MEIADKDIAFDVEAMIESFRVQKTRRYFKQKYWDVESREAIYSKRIEGPLRLEDVAAHSWHVADTVLLLIEHFDWLNPQRCLEVALIHDKLEMYTGDFNPVGRDGKGSKTHAYNLDAQSKKTRVEEEALQHHLLKLRPHVREHYKSIFSEAIRCKTQESLFVKAIDKLQAFAYVHVKKDGYLSDNHILFTLPYSEKCKHYFPPLEGHYEYLKFIFLKRVALRRGCTVKKLCRDLFSQSELDL